MHFGSLIALQSLGQHRYSVAADAQSTDALSVEFGTLQPRYAWVSTNSSTQQQVAFGDSTTNAETDPWFILERLGAGHLLNISGMTHIAHWSVGGGSVFFNPVEVTVLRSPPQVDGVALVVSSASGPATAIATLSNGERPKYVMVTTSDTAACTIAFGDSTVANGASTTWAAINGGSGPIIFNVSGLTHFDWNGTNGDVVVASLTF